MLLNPVIIAQSLHHSSIFSWLMPLLLEPFLHMDSGSPCFPGSVSPHYPLLLLSLLLLPLNLKPLNAGMPRAQFMNLSPSPLHSLGDSIQYYGLNQSNCRSLPDWTSVLNSKCIYPPKQAIALLKPNMPKPFPDLLPPHHQPTCSPPGSSTPCFAQANFLRVCFVLFYFVFVSSFSLMPYVPHPMHQQILLALPSNCEKWGHFPSPSHPHLDSHSSLLSGLPASSLLPFNLFLSLFCLKPSKDPPSQRKISHRALHICHSSIPP